MRGQDSGAGCVLKRRGDCKRGKTGKEFLRYFKDPCAFKKRSAKCTIEISVLHVSPTKASI